jgi:hypothetical protein
MLLTERLSARRSAQIMTQARPGLCDVVMEYVRSKHYEERAEVAEMLRRHPELHGTHTLIWFRPKSGYQTVAFVPVWLCRSADPELDEVVVRANYPYCVVPAEEP